MKETMIESFLEILNKNKQLPRDWKITPQDDRHSGKDAVFTRLKPFISPIDGLDGRAVLLLDLDERTYDQFFVWVAGKLRALMPSEIEIVSHPPESRLQLFEFRHENRVGHLVVVAVGRPNHEELKSKYGVECFSMDDWVFPLSHIDAVHTASGDFRHVPLETLLKLHLEVAALFRASQLTVNKSKTYLHILRAACGIGASATTVFGKIVEKSYEQLGPERMSKELEDILADLTQAGVLLQAA